MQSKSGNFHHTDPLSVNQVKIEFTSKEITSLGGLLIIAGFLEEIGFKEWVEESFPVEEASPNGKGKYPEVLSLFLTALSGGNRGRDGRVATCVVYHNEFSSAPGILSL